MSECPQIINHDWEKWIPVENYRYLKFVAGGGLLCMRI
jgi:hypothetical protein